MQVPYQPFTSPTNVTNVQISPEDILKIAMAVKSCIHEDLKEMINEAIDPLQEEMKALKEENQRLKLQIDEVEQYGRRSLIRVSGIPEIKGENTTEKILEVTSKAGIDIDRRDIELSHRVGKPGSRSAPRQIIARMSSVEKKFQLLTSSKSLRAHPETKHIAINEDLTRFRDYLCFVCRRLKKTHQITKVWTTNGKIQIRDNDDKIHIIREERDLIPFGHTP